MREFSKKIVYSKDPSNYKAWADAMWARGFNTSQEEVMNLLSVSRNWVVLTLLNEIPYVTYSYKYLYQKGVKSRVTTYIDMEDLIQWIMQVGQFRRQTELVDLYSYLSLANKHRVLSKSKNIAIKIVFLIFLSLQLLGILRPRLGKPRPTFGENPPD